MRGRYKPCVNLSIPENPQYKPISTISTAILLRDSVRQRGHSLQHSVKEFLAHFLSPLLDEVLRSSAKACHVSPSREKSRPLPGLAVAIPSVRDGVPSRILSQSSAGR